MGGAATFKFGRWGLGCIVGAAFWLVFYALITPLREHEAQLHAAIADVRGQISKSRSRVGEIRELQRKAAAARNKLQSLDNDLPVGSPVVWIPQLAKAHFSRFGFANLNISMESTSDEPGLPDYQRMNWSVAVPIQDVTKQAGALLAAVAALDQSQPVLHVVDLEIPPEADEAGKYSAKFRFSMAARKQP